MSRRYAQLAEEIEGLNTELERLTAFAPMLMALLGIGTDTNSALLATVRSNPESLKSEAAFAALCEVNPIAASSGKTNRYRLDRGGDRRENAALYRIVVVSYAMTFELRHICSGEWKRARPKPKRK